MPSRHSIKFLPVAEPAIRTRHDRDDKRGARFDEEINRQD
jgi:hypothetical protein